MEVKEIKKENKIAANFIGLLVGLFVVFLFSSSSFAQSVSQQCTRNGIGDVVCPSGGGAYEGLSFDSSTVLTDVLGGSSPITQILTGSSSVIPSSFLADLMSGLGVLRDIGCGASSFNADYTSYVMNSMVSTLSEIDDLSSFDPISFFKDTCDEINAANGGGSSNGFVNAEGVGGDRIASCAEQMVGQTTADDPITEGGSLGCALAVSRILECSGYGIGTEYGTVGVKAKLEADSCYEKVHSGCLSGSDAMNLQPGDVFVTPSTTGANRVIGHTGVYVGDGTIVSNSSSGYSGSSPGTIQPNYTVDKWNGSSCGGEGRGVIARRPDESAIYRRICE